MKYLKLKKVLIDMWNSDQNARNGVNNGEEIEKIDEKNIRILRKIIKKYGWPSINMVGREANRTAWIVAQHSDFGLKFQKKCLSLLKKSVSVGESEKEDLAYLTDRVLVNEGKKQLYGTQFYINKKGVFTYRSIINKKDLNQRRKAMNMGKFEVYEKNLKDKQKRFANK